MTYSLPLTLRDDENALEDIESFVLRLESPQPANVDTSSTTTVNIVDDDGSQLIAIVIIVMLLIFCTIFYQLCL